MAQKLTNLIMNTLCNPETQKQQSLTLCISENTGVHCYDKKNNIKLKAKIESSKRIFKNDKTGEIKVVSLSDIKKGKLFTKDFSHMLSIDLNFSQQKGKTYLIHGQKQKYPYDQQFDTFVSLRDFTQKYNKNGYKLRSGDCFKVAYIPFKVLFIKNQGEQMKYCENSQDIICQNIDIQGQCRICLSSQSQGNDFIINPCECKGSCATVHYKCLRKWIQSKVKITRRKSLIQYDFSDFKCQICKSKIAKCFVRKKQKKTIIYYLFNFYTPLYQKSIVLKQNKKWYLFTFPQDDIAVIGRSMSSSDLYLCDNHVSNIHCCIQYHDKDFYLSDLTSSYGTYVNLDRNFVINKQVQLVIGDYFMEFKMEDEDK